MRKDNKQKADTDCEEYTTSREELFLITDQLERRGAMFVRVTLTLSRDIKKVDIQFIEKKYQR